MNTQPFITYEDFVYFSKNNIIYALDIPIFLKEISNYFNSVWPDEYHITHLSSIDELNYNYLEQYPSTAGYYILDSAFTCGQNEILSDKSKFILGYLYQIHLR